MSSFLDQDSRAPMEYYLVRVEAIPPTQFNAENGMRNNQMYNPTFSMFWNHPDDTDYYGLNGDAEYRRIAFNHRYHVVSAEQGKVYDSETKQIVDKNVFVKYSPLLDPFKYMVGKYKPVDDPKLRTLPAPPLIGTSDTVLSSVGQVHPKMDHAMNSSYVDCFFYYLSSMLLNHHGFVHGIDFYGSYLGILDEFRINIEEDVEYLADSPFFMSNIGKLMALEHCEHTEFADAMQNIGSGTNGGHGKPTIHILPDTKNDPMDDTMDDVLDLIIDPIEDVSDDPHLSELEITIDALDPDLCIDDERNIHTDFDREDSEAIAPFGRCPSTYSSGLQPTEYEDDTDDDTDDSQDDNSGDGHEASNVSHDDDDNDDDDNDDDSQDDDDDDDDESTSEHGSEHDSPPPIARIFRFPTQAIHLERCTGTLDELLDHNTINPDEIQSAFFQIIMILLVYQRTFQFTHNDLHTNNIMYISTDIPYLWYHFQDVTYRVPTHGRLYKIIDYGRSIYTFRGRKFCSDSFAQGGDGATQYNCEPFLNPNKPRLDPNPSFDLCRLGCSIYDFLYEDGPDQDKDKATDKDLKETIKRWCTSDSGVNMLYKPNGSERFPGFKLYKMIARMVHQHTPEAQLSHAWFQAFVVATDSTEKPADNEPYMNLHTIPIYHHI